MITKDNYLVENNDIVKKVKELTLNSDYIIVEGIRATQSFFSSPYYEIVLCVITKKLAYNKNIKYKKNKTVIVTSAIMKRISLLSSQSDILFVAKKIFLPLPQDLESTVILDNISDPGNVGSIIRTMVALGKKNIFMIGGCNINNNKLIQATVGMIGHINVIRGNWDIFLSIRKKDYPIFALSAEGENIFDFRKEILIYSYIVIGNEAHGVTEELKRNSDKILSLPMDEKCESLNAAIAASIVGYFIWRK
jgi:TrmH family RNA methyltransferase